LLKKTCNFFNCQLFAKLNLAAKITCLRGIFKSQNTTSNFWAI
jgi:hypothetical protein